MVKSSDAESTKTAINSSYTQSTRTFNDTNHDEDTSTNSFSTSKLLETQECDGPCHKIINYSDLHIFSCGHVLCANCCSELTTKGVDPDTCILGKCLKPMKFKDSAADSDNKN